MDEPQRDFEVTLDTNGRIEVPQQIDFAEIHRNLLEDDFDNPQPDLERGTRTRGESTNEEVQEFNEDRNADEPQRDFEVKMDANGRIEGRFENDKVINLSKRALTESEISILSKGLKFVATPKEIDFSQIKIDLENFGRRLRLKWHFRESEDFSEYPTFKPRSKFNPRNKDVAIEVYLSKIEDEIMKISVEGNNFSNISREEKLALDSLKCDRSIVIKEADKGSGVVVWDREAYIKEAQNQLGDTAVYAELDSDPSEHLQQIIDNTINNIREQDDIDERTSEYLLVNNPKLGRFYLLPKIHKRLNSVPGRPVISNCGFYTENISQFLDHHLQPLAKSVRSYIKDTNHFLQKIANLDELPENAILCTVDVVGLYLSIPHDEGLEALRVALNGREDQSVSTSSLVELADLVLKNNFFEFNGSYFQQLRGTAIGTKCAPSYAILFLAALEEKLLEEAQYKPFIWWRFIDDIFLVWLHGEEKLSEFINFLNGAHHSIKFTAEWFKEKINFLDVQVIREGTKLMTDLYSKPTDTHQLLHRTSCHPNHTKKGIPYSQALRMRRICSEDRFFENRVADLKTWLLDRGYTEGDIDEQVDRVKGLDRVSLLSRQQQPKDDTRIPLVFTYHPALHRVYEVLRQSQNILLVDTEHRNLFKDKIFISFRKAKSLKDNLGKTATIGGGVGGKGNL